MRNQSRLIWIGSAFAAFSIGGVAHAQNATTAQPPKTQLPQQVLPTGAEDAVAARAPAARSATATPDASQLERELIHMTSESDAGLVAVKQSDGSTRVNLDGRFMSVLVSTPTSDGGNEVSCHSGKDAQDQVKHTQQVLAGTAPKPQKTAHTAPVLEEK